MTEAMIPDGLIRILLVDHHAIVRAGLRLLLEAQPDFSVVAEGARREEAVQLARAEQPDIILLDIDLGEENGIEFLPELLDVTAHARVILLTGVKDAGEHRRGVRAGAMGVVLKDQPAEVLTLAIKKVHEGEAWIDRTLTASVLAELAHTREHSQPDPEMVAIAGLTHREHEVITLLCEGLKNKQIAERLMITETTVRHHLTSIFSKLRVANRLELIIFAYRYGLGGPSR